jgi:hypothetical protein
MCFRVSCGVLHCVVCCCVVVYCFVLCVVVLLCCVVRCCVVMLWCVVCGVLCVCCVVLYRAVCSALCAFVRMSSTASRTPAYSHFEHGYLCPQKRPGANASNTTTAVMS